MPRGQWPAGTESMSPAGPEMSPAGPESMGRPAAGSATTRVLSCFRNQRLRTAASTSRGSEQFRQSRQIDNRAPQPLTTPRDRLRVVGMSNRRLQGRSGRPKGRLGHRRLDKHLAKTRSAHMWGPPFRRRPAYPTPEAPPAPAPAPLLHPAQGSAWRVSLRPPANICDHDWLLIVC